MCLHAAVDRGRNEPGLFRPRSKAALKHACCLGRHSCVLVDPGRRLRLAPLHCALGYDVLPFQGKDGKYCRCSCVSSLDYSSSETAMAPSETSSSISSF